MRWALRAEGSHCSITWPVLLVNLILFFHSPLHCINKWTTFHKFLTCDTSFTLSFQTFKFTCSTKYTDLLSTYHTDYFSSAMILRTTWIMQCVDRGWSLKKILFRGIITTREGETTRICGQLVTRTALIYKPRLRTMTRQDSRCYFNVRSTADTNTTTKKCKTKKLKSKNEYAQKSH